ncbi:MAG: LysR family transcriptional regulator [Firmicutes bacterium]|nr:LysR family transcriptional regulator [Bacillota bacterium]
MINNYQYFIALADTLNISKAAKRLFVSHQCLSRYIKTLEQTYGTTFFERSPRLSLTPAGQAYLKAVRQIQMIETNLESEISDIRQSKQGVLRFGTTSGRYRILVPDAIAAFKQLYPEVTLDVTYSADSTQLCEHILKNEMDIALLNKNLLQSEQLNLQTVLRERFFLVITDAMLMKYFPDDYPACKKKFEKGVNLKDFEQIPFVVSQRNQHTRIVLEPFLRDHAINLNFVLELPEVDLQIVMTQKNYAASFCWSMFLPTIRKLNEEAGEAHLNYYPVRDWSMINEVVVVTKKDKILPEYGRKLIGIFQMQCLQFANSYEET